MITKEGFFQSERELLELDIVDWNRLNNYWDNTYEAVQAIASCLIGLAGYSIIQCDMNAAPVRDDWPGWKHVGTHEQMGRLFWNWFHWQPRGEIHFSDSPDFWGRLTPPNRPVRHFWGDIGKVSASTFIRTLKMMNANDLWISVKDSQTQIVIEPIVSIREIWFSMLA